VRNKETLLHVDFEVTEEREIELLGNPHAIFLVRLY